VLFQGREKIPVLLSVRLADIMAHSRSQVMRSLEEYEKFYHKLQQLMATGEEFVMKELAVNGNDVIRETGVSPGPLVGKILRTLWQEVLDDPRKNKREYLLRLAKRIVNDPR
jgi:tRNA nucleotidyltransferase (CCA-adding enzyme)